MSVKIYCPTKNAMQSGKAKEGVWVLEYESKATRYTDPLMGWVGNSDTQQQLRLKFSSQEDAVNYAKRNKLTYSVSEPKKRNVIIRAYSDNFTD